MWGGSSAAMVLSSTVGEVDQRPHCRGRKPDNCTDDDPDDGGAEGRHQRRQHGTDYRIESHRQRIDHPTLPSREMPMSFCASTANSIGSSWITSFTKPLTMSAIASS